MQTATTPTLYPRPGTAAVIRCALGWLRVEFIPQAITSIEFLQSPTQLPESVALSLPSEFESAILCAASGRRFQCPPLHPHGTDFQKAVWKKLQAIPFGVTRSYAQIAAATGKPGAARAVGAACAANPIPLLIPCHRVIASNGTLGGFSGGLAIKKALLRAENAISMEQ
jgi:methylated-DNA-[protein]-cysteine S-methyltransferase